MEEFTEQLRKYLVDSLLTLKAMPLDVKATALYESKIQIIENLLIFVNKYQKGEDMKMKEGKIEFGDLLDIDDLPAKASENSIKALIKAQAPKIPKGKMQIVKVASGKWQSVTNAISVLKSDNELDKSFRASKRGNTIYLIHE